MYPTPIMRFRKALGFCSSCWNQSNYKMKVTSQGTDVAGNPVVKEHRLAACFSHATSTVAAVMDVPHTGTVKLVGGGEISWSNPDPDNWDGGDDDWLDDPDD